jgi:deoxyribonuclease IV
MLTIGCHLSFSKGYLSMAKTAASIGANTFQFFTRNPRGGKAKEIDPADLSSFKTFANENGITTFLAHAPYTLNFCAAKPEIRTFAISTLKDDLSRMENTPNQMYNIHPGSHVGQGIEKGIELISEAVNEALSEEQTTTLLFETMAGKGSEVGSTFKEIKSLIDNVNLKSHVGVCLDTCHVWEGGYDIKDNLEATLEEFDKIVGLDHLKAIHLNDSKNPLGAHKDRHEAIGLGQIGFEALSKITNHERLRKLPFFLETPHDNLSGYAKEIEMLKSAYNS